jgi:trimethylamine--corrinoid protein Co-methyltransferase
MPLKGFVRKFKPLEILSDEDIESIHKSTLDVLKETGVIIDHKKALDLFKRSDCIVDYDKKRVRMPEALVECELKRAPSSYRMKARNRAKDLIVGGNTVYFKGAPGFYAADIENNTWETRSFTRKEYYDYVTITDVLENLHLQGPYPIFGFDGIPDCMKIVEGIAAKFRNSSKANYDAGGFDTYFFGIKMAQTLNTEFSAPICASSPLTFYKEQIDIAFALAEAKFPAFTISGCSYGGSGPVTIAGSIVLDNAEVIAGVVLLQLINPGQPVCTIDQTNPLNMKTGSPNFDNIASALHMAAGTQIWRKYGIPHMFAAAGYTNAKKLDIQCGYERGINAIIQALCGANFIMLHGGIYGEYTAHPLAAIIDDDIAGMVGRFIEGVEVNSETIALELIEEVGPAPGFYLNKEHTRKWWEKEQYISKVADDLNYQLWVKEGKKTTIDYAKKRMKEILDNHCVDIPLTQEQDEEIEKILVEARKWYENKDLM